jgi:hypothetical protein
MSGPQFFETLMGRKFFEADVPRALRALERLAAAIEALKPSASSVAEVPEDGTGAQPVPVPPSAAERASTDSMEWSCTECGGTDVWAMVSQQLNTGERMISSNELVDARCMQCFMLRHKNSTKARFGPKKEIKP